MIDLDDLRLFRALGASRSLAGAARLLNLTPPAVSVRLQRIEARLGLRLATRESRGFVLTAEGTRLLEESVELLERLESLSTRVVEQAGSVAGQLRVVAPFGFGRAHVAPLVRDLHRAHPGLAITLMLAESPLAAAAGADVVISIGATRASQWVGHLLAPNERFLCASPALARKLGPLAHPSELTRHPCLSLLENDEDVARLRFMPADSSDGNAALGPEGRSRRGVTVRLAGALSSNDGTVISGWAASGLGIAERSEWDAAPLIAARTLVRVLPGWRLEPAPVMALLPSRHGVTQRQRLFLDAAKAAFDPPPWRR